MLKVLRYYITDMKDLTLNTVYKYGTHISKRTGLACLEKIQKMATRLIHGGLEKMS